MNEIPVKIYSDAINCPVVQMTGRRFPGVLLQGDSLKILLGMAEEVCELCQEQNSSEALEVARGLKEKLKIYVDHYEDVMTASGLELPYVK